MYVEMILYPGNALFICNFCVKYAGSLRDNHQQRFYLKILHNNLITNGALCIVDLDKLH